MSKQSDEASGYILQFLSAVSHLRSRAIVQVSLHLVSHCLGENGRQLDLRFADRKKDFHPGSSVPDFIFFTREEITYGVACHFSPLNAYNRQQFFFLSNSKFSIKFFTKFEINKIIILKSPILIITVTKIDE